MLAGKLVSANPTTEASLAYAAYVGSTTDINANSTRTISAMGIGTANSKRYVIAAVYYRNDSQPSTYPTLTIGGVSTTRIADVGSFSANQYAFIVITDSAITSGTTADVVITNNAILCTRYQVFTYAFTPSGSAPVVLDTDFQTTGSVGATLSFDFSAAMSTSAKGVHVSYSPNTSTISSATGDMTYDVTTQTIDTGRVRVGSIVYDGVYTTPYTSVSYNLHGVAVVLA